MNSVLFAVLGVLLAIAIGVIAYFAYFLKKQSQKPQDDPALKVMMEWMKEIKESTDKTRAAMDQNLSSTTKSINERLDAAARYIADMKKEMGGITHIGPDIKRLTETLASPKMRGNFGEQMLENLLAQFLPQGGFAMQHKFRNGETVDAVVKVGKTMLSVDSKFSMENFRLYKQAQTEEAQENLRKHFIKDVKKRVDEIHRKYILPQEGTFDFALMYVPSEGVYQEAIVDAGLMDYCQEKRVLPVGPNSLFAYLQNIIVSLRGQEINKIAQELLTMIQGIKQESEKFDKNLGILSGHIIKAGNTMGVVSNDYLKLKSSIQNAASLKLEEPASGDDQQLLN
ncbi:MAG: DNA recombination protein RmuC [Candidatus Doudnabacteria bacterium]|nr:DNA recombination protein RmuC [Candidatus Doudnabacteria bacterium]